MTVSCETRRFTYACDGETRKWPVEFNYIDGGTVKVFLISAGGDESEVKNITVSGGYVTAPATGEPFAVGNSVRVERILPFTQLDDYTAQGNFTPENMERTADNMVMLAQQIRDVADDTEGYVSDNLGKIEEYKDAAARIRRGSRVERGRRLKARRRARLRRLRRPRTPKTTLYQPNRTRRQLKRLLKPPPRTPRPRRRTPRTPRQPRRTVRRTQRDAKDDAVAAKTAAERRENRRRDSQRTSRDRGDERLRLRRRSLGQRGRAAAESASQAASSAASMTPSTAAPLPRRRRRQRRDECTVRQRRPRAPAGGRSEVVCRRRDGRNGNCRHNHR